MILTFDFFFWNQRIDSCNSQWEKIWENLNLYVERLKGCEIVLNGLEVMNKFVSSLETQLISKNKQYDPEALCKVHTCSRISRFNRMLSTNWPRKVPLFVN
jgi:hypothetical protein